MSQLNDFIQDLQWKLGERRREVTIGASGLLVALLAGLLVWWAFFVRWQPPPSIFDSPVQDVLGYLAMDDFSQLPMEERVRFLIEFSDRFRGMEQSDSATMAAFIAGATGPVRETAVQNIRVLAKDIMVDGAAEYVNLPFADRAAFLDEWVLKWTALGERAVTGEDPSGTDEERLADMRADAERDTTREIDESRIPDLTTVGAVRFMDFWSSEVETSTSPREQGQIVVFMRDLRKHFTGN